MAAKGRSETDPRFCSLGRATVRRQLQRLRSEADGVLANADVECVHRMRVASRRMRAALVVFEGCFPRKRFRRWSKQMKLVTRALGAARDTDVQIIYLKELRSRSNDEQMPGVAQMIEAKVALRVSLQKELEGALERLMEGKAIDEMDRATRPDIKEGKGGTWRRSRALAYLDLLHRTTELRFYAPHVHSEGAKEKHHQMRIAAKHLRYTIEIFRNLYKDHLAEELNATKRLQEILGEMHDCDVWEDEMAKLLSLPEVGEEALRPGYAFLLKDRKEFRAQNYRAFVALWDGMEEKGLYDAMLEGMAKSAEAALKLEERTEAELELRPETKVAIIGDVHANLHALRAVLEDAERRGAAIVINTGDSVGYGPNPEETLVLLRERKANSVAGNFDLKVLRAGPKIKAKREGDKWYGLGWTYRRLSKSGRDYLRSLPREIRFEAAGRTILITHGSPDSMDEYVGPQTPRERLEQLARSSRADLMITGHAHRAFDAVVGGTRFINSGSVGRQDDGDPRATYALLTLEPYQVEHFRIEYDVQGAVDAMRERGFPEEFGRMLLEGRSLDYIKDRTPSKTDRQLKTAVEAAWKFNDTYLKGDKHSRNVSEVASQLFDCLKDLHHQGAEGRALLECAAACHDVGWVEGQLAHNKTSMRMVLEEETLPLAKRERVIVALVARYHRKAHPRKDHPHYCNLDKEGQQEVRELASILRLADGLDASHRGVVEGVRCEHDADRIILHLAHTLQPGTEERDASGKGDLAIAVFRRDLQFVWDGN